MVDCLAEDISYQYSLCFLKEDWINTVLLKVSVQVSTFFFLLIISLNYAGMLKPTTFNEQLVNSDVDTFLKNLLQGVSEDYKLLFLWFFLNT